MKQEQHNNAAISATEAQQRCTEAQQGRTHEVDSEVHEGPGDARGAVEPEARRGAEVLLADGAHVVVVGQVHAVRPHEEPRKRLHLREGVGRG